MKNLQYAIPCLKEMMCKIILQICLKTISNILFNKYSYLGVYSTFGFNSISEKPSQYEIKRIIFSKKCCN